jgi:predicted MFS family arabinose efflux permease
LSILSLLNRDQMTRFTPMHRQVLRLAAAQALIQTASALIMTIGSLAGRAIAGPGLATVPISALMLGTALTTVPASLWMARVGRRAGFVAGAMLGALGGLVAAAGVYQGSLLLLSFGTLLVGSYQGFAMFYRFAASEVSDDAFRPRAISLVLAGGVVSALLGPPLARLGAPLLEPRYLGSFLIVAAVALVAIVLLLGVDVPPPVSSPGGKETPRPLFEIMRQPNYAVALFAAASGAGIMILAMTSTPLAMAVHQHDLADTSSVIQAHILGMFLPSFFTGSLIARFGIVRIMLAGTAIIGGHVAMSLSGTGFGSYAAALFLLGVGWNFLFVGGTTLLTQSYRPVERGRAQAANDLVIYLVGLLGALGAGPLLDALGWRTMNLLLLPWLALVASVIMVNRQTRGAVPLSRSGEGVRG